MDENATSRTSGALELGRSRRLLAQRASPPFALGARARRRMTGWRTTTRLIADNSPDELMARGVPEEFVTIATGRLDGINEAYNAILKERRV